MINALTDKMKTLILTKDIIKHVGAFEVSYKVDGIFVKKETLKVPYNSLYSGIRDAYSVSNGSYSESCTSDLFDYVEKQFNKNEKDKLFDQLGIEQ